MKKSKVIFLALLACAFGASARTVSPEEVKSVASVWARTGTAMGLRLPSTVLSAVEYSVTNGYKFYEVKMVGGGTVFMTSDTEFIPVIGFSAKGNLDLSAGSKLRRILEGDIALRAAMKSGMASPALRMMAASATQTTVASTTASESETLWAALLKRSKPTLTISTAASPATSVVQPTVDVDDVCVAPLVETQWSQTTHDDSVNGYKCYNYYTPDEDPCGCTATALSQIMRYFRYPTAELAQQGFPCTVEGEATTLTTLGGIYDWAKMAPKPATTNDDAVFEAIGRLTYDTGVALQSEYTSGETSAVLYDAPDALRNYFGYASAFCFFDEAAWSSRWPLHTQSTIEKVIYANLDARRPVELGVYGYSRDGWHQWGGHAIVGDGYGYKTVSDVRTPFVHLNLGWSGNDDMWYNLPTIRTGTGIVPGGPAYDFDYLGMALFNIVPEGEAAGKEILSGRTVDVWGKVVSNAIVTVRLDGDVVATTSSDERGIYAFALVGGKTYEVTAVSEDGTQLGRHDPVVLGTTKGDLHGVVASVVNVGNSWGNDMVLAEPTARIVVGAVTNVYTSLDRALQAATNGNDVVELLLPTTLKQSVEILSDCTIVATNAEPAASMVTCLNGTRITVAGDVTVTMTNVVFDVTEKAKTVTVSDGGVLKIGGICGLKAVETQRAENLVVVSGLLEPLYVDCANASRKDDTFALGELDYATAAKCANLLLHYSNSRLGGKAADAGGVMFRWAQGVPVPRSEAICQLNGENYRSLADMFEDFRQNTNSEIVVFGDATFTNYVQLVTNLTIRGEGEIRPVLTAAGTSGFYIAAGASLSVSNLVFKGYVDAGKSDDYGFIGINGGELTLDDGAVLDGLVGNARRGSGIVDLMSGMVTMREGAGIVNCRAEGGDSGTGLGGAVYVLGTGCMLNLEGGVISNCYASSHGGGVYAYGSNKNAGINISGKLTIADNRSGNNTTADDLYMNTAAALPGLKLTGSVAGGRIGIRYASSTTSGNVEGNAFMTNAVGTVSKRTLGAFFNDTDDALEAAVGNNGMLVWAKKDMSETCSPDKATTHVYYPDGGEAHYPDFVTALEHMTNGTVATVKMYKEGQPGELFDADVELPSGCKVVLMSCDAGAYEFWRDGDVGLTVAGDASLTLTNILFKHVDHNRATKPYLEVAGGSLTLMSGACVEAGTGNTCRDANGITVYKGGVFTMLPGAKVCDCYSSWNEGKFTPDAKTQYYAVGGGVLIDGASTAYLRGGEIAGCHAPRGGGLYACNGSKVYVSGDMKLVGNREISYESGVPGNPSNLLVTDRAELYLDNVLTGDVHVANSVRWRGDTNIVATVDASWQWGVTSLTNSAAHFVSDETGDFGVIVTNTTETLVVWRGAVRNGVFVSQDTVRDDKAFYVMAGAGAYTPLSMGPLPELDPNAKTADAVKSALTISDLADKSVEDAINGSDDPVDAYEKFREWAMGVTSDVDAVVKSDNAGVSYDFGTTELLTNDPTVEIVELAEDDGLEISIVVKDGEDPVKVASKKVAEMLEGSTDVSAWDDNRIELTVMDLTQTTASKVSFKVKPADDAPTAFIRVKR